MLGVSSTHNASQKNTICNHFYGGEITPRFSSSSYSLPHDGGDTNPNDMVCGANLKELPYRLHDFAWWNLIDIGEMYVALQADGEGPG